MNEEFDEIEKQLWEQLGKPPTPDPSQAMNPRFHAMLDTYKAKIEDKKANIFSAFFLK
ncbi:MAG: hypothetical protein U5M51_02075 [Emticicia sp.]|nr:hypothetical protein [Emticicia sp.]